jgi:large subunit ribosomal protein L10
MAITKQKKANIIERLETVRDNSSAIVFVHFVEMNGPDITAMRAEMRAEGVDYFVAKKTLMRRVFADHYEGSMPELDGEIAIAYSTDAIAPAQRIKAFAATHKDKIIIAGGVFQGVFKNAEEMTEIASIPALPVLRGMFVNVINSPIQGLVLGLNAIADKKSA